MYHYSALRYDNNRHLSCLFEIVDRYISNETNKRILSFVSVLFPLTVFTNSIFGRHYLEQLGFTYGSSFKSIKKIDSFYSYVILSCQTFSFYAINFCVDEHLTCSSSILSSSSPRTPGKKAIKGDPIITGIRLRPFLDR